MIFASMHAKSVNETVKTDTNKPSEVASSSITDSDLTDCEVLLGRNKKNNFIAFLDSLKNKAGNGGVQTKKDYADILQNRFTCIEVEITGNSSWLQYEQDQNGKITGESPRKIITSIRSNIVAFNALNEVVSAYTAISDKAVGARIVLGDYHLRYRDALGNIEEGYKFLSGANNALCIKKIIDDEDKFGCNLINYKLEAYKKILGPENCEKLDKQAEVWSSKYIEESKLAEEANAAESESGDEAEEGELIETAKLKGRDFELTASAMSGDYIEYQNKYQYISIVMSKGKELTEYTINETGKKFKIQEIGFAPGDVFKLKNLLPGEPREQVVVKGSEWFPRGEGTAEDYSIYRIDDNGITQLLLLTTKRDFEGVEGHNRPAINFKATVEERIENGKLTIVYKYANKKGKRRKLNFTWDGSKFNESSGKYKEVKEILGE